MTKDKPVELTKTKRGVVVKCPRLNIRKAPVNRIPNVVAIVDAGTVLTFEPTETKDWYKVRTANGIHGFCRAEFVEEQTWKAS